MISVDDEDYKIFVRAVVIKTWEFKEELEETRRLILQSLKKKWKQIKSC